MDLPNDVVGCDFCENSSATPGRVIYVCDMCGAECCSSCSINDPEDMNRVLCAPDSASGRAACAPDDWA